MNRTDTLVRMDVCLAQWARCRDRRADFLGCYRLMTGNMVAALQAGEFHDSAWVGRLLHRFAGYYFDGMAQCEAASADAPTVWSLANRIAADPASSVLVNVLLGVNAHINYDLVLTLHDMLADEWDSLSADARHQRYADHCHVNAIIARTIDTVQAEIVEPQAPWLDIVDKLLGRADEWAISRLITSWREEVWRHAISMVTAPDATARAAVRDEVALAATRRAQTIARLHSVIGT